MDNTDFWLGRTKRPAPGCKHPSVKIVETAAAVAELYFERGTASYGYMVQLVHRGRCDLCGSDLTKVTPMAHLGRFADRAAAYAEAMAQLERTVEV